MFSIAIRLAWFYNEMVEESYMNCKQDICHISKQIVKSIDISQNDHVLFFTSKSAHQVLLIC